MPKRENIEDKNSCLGKAADDEPIFILRGSNPSAISAISAWIDSRVKLGKNQNGDLKIRSAIQVMMDMESYLDRQIEIKASNAAVTNPEPTDTDY